MSLVKPVVYDNVLQRQVAQGDTLAGGAFIPATVVTTAITVTGQQLLNRYILRNPAAAGTDTIDSAANLITAFTGGWGNASIQNGTSFEVEWICTTANAITVQATANTGVTVNRGTVNASSSKKFLCTVVNGTPPKTAVGNTTNASAVVTGLSLADTSAISVGMVVTNAVNGLQGTTVISVQPGIGFTLSGNANATSTTPVAIMLSPVVQLDGISQGLI